jgi:hypothetical protein
LANFDAGGHAGDISLNLKCGRCGLASKDENDKVSKIIGKEIRVDDEKRM